MKNLILWDSLILYQIFTTSEAKRDYEQLTWYVRVASRAAERLTGTQERSAKSLNIIEL